ncbi:hypothetical protein [Pilimelia anulata]|uniref:hypothetical protein n=1 Tax=Pilimelia anulata TaxID=53371 RepID=UPI00166D1A93|nr:hypothetical protein [Pilimelia anulata]
MNIWLLWGVCALLGLLVLGGAARAVLRRLGPLRRAVVDLSARQEQARALQGRLEALRERAEALAAHPALADRAGERRADGAA